MAAFSKRRQENQPEIDRINGLAARKKPFQAQHFVLGKKDMSCLYSTVQNDYSRYWNAPSEHIQKTGCNTVFFWAFQLYLLNLGSLKIDALNPLSATPFCLYYPLT